MGKVGGWENQGWEVWEGKRPFLRKGFIHSSFPSYMASSTGLFCSNHSWGTFL